MLTTYIACFAAAGALLALSFFGDFLDGDADLAVDADIDGDAFAGAASSILSLRTVVYALFGFGAAGTTLHLLWGGDRSGTTALAAAGAGLVSGVLVSTVFRYLKDTEAGAIEGAESFVGLAGKVSVEIGPGSPGLVQVERGGRRVRIRARVNDAYAGEGPLEVGRPVVVVEMPGRRRGGGAGGREVAGRIADGSPGVAVASGSPAARVVRAQESGQGKEPTTGPQTRERRTSRKWNPCNWA